MILWGQNATALGDSVVEPTPQAGRQLRKRNERGKLNAAYICHGKIPSGYTELYMPEGLAGLALARLLYFSLSPGVQLREGGWISKKRPDKQNRASSIQETPQVKSEPKSNAN